MVVAVDHRSSPLTIRDRLFVADHDHGDFLDRLRSAGIQQAVLISTCDRIEVHAIHQDAETAAPAIIGVMGRHADMASHEIQSYLKVWRGEEAVRHLFSVTASLESLVLGEPHILGQIKASHREAQDAGMVGRELDGLLQSAYFAAKRVRTETTIGERPVSLASVATDLARSVHGRLNRCQALLIGAGEIGGLIGEALQSAGLGHCLVTHPTAARAESLATSLNSNVVAFDALADRLADADISVTSLGARQRVIGVEMIKAALRMRRNRPMLVIDAGVPSDVDPAVDRLDQVFLYDLNDLERLAMDGRARRENEAASAAAIINDEVAAFLRSQAERAAVPALVALRQHFESVRQATLADAGGDAEKATRLLVHRLLHDPSEVLREIAAEGSGSKGVLHQAEQTIARLFRLDRRDQDGKP